MAPRPAVVSLVRQLGAGLACLVVACAVGGGVAMAVLTTLMIFAVVCLVGWVLMGQRCSAAWCRCCPCKHGCGAGTSGVGASGAGAALLGEEITATPPRPAQPPVAAPPARPARLLFLDNLKVVLTAVVVAHHTACIFSGTPSFYVGFGAFPSAFGVFGMGLMLLNQSYFMALFFFVSAYFVPGSFARKGWRAFLADRALRLGAPFLCYLFVGGPALQLLLRRVLLRGEVGYGGGGGGYGWDYVADPGPPWFVCWLLVLNMCYAFVQVRAAAAASTAAAATPELEEGAAGGAGRAAQGSLNGGGHSAATADAAAAAAATDDAALPPIPLPPTFGRCMLAGLVLGVAQAAVCAAIPRGGFMMMPLSYGSLPFDLAAFGVGLVAKRRGWLTPGAPGAIDLAVMRARARAVAALGSIVVWGGLAVLYRNGGGFLLPTARSDYPNPNKPGADDDAPYCYYDNTPRPDGVVGDSVALVYFASLIFMGPVAIAISLAALDIFQQHANFTSKRVRWLAAQAYAVYLIHPWVAVPVSWAFFQISSAVLGTDAPRFYPIDNATAPLSCTQLGEGSLWLGWTCSTALSLLVVWPLASQLRKLPGAREVL